MRLFTIKMLMGPFFFYQAFRLRKNIVILPDPEGALKGSQGDGPLLKVLLVGDSAAVGVGVDTQDETLKGRLVNRLIKDHKVHYEIKAKSGSNSRGTIKILTEAKAEDFDIALISLGVNDITVGMTNYTFRKLQKKIIQILKQKFNVKQVILSGVPPIGKFPVLPQPSRWFLGKTAAMFDNTLRQLAESEQCYYVAPIDSDDVTLLASDGFHPGPKIYDYWAEKAYQSINSANLIQ